jgi:hypothetical protein
MRLYYMTSHRIAVDHILPERRMKLSRFHELNDPFELKPYTLEDKDLRKFTDTLEREYFSRRGILCFSDNWRSPVMWAHYAEKHQGVCLGFDVANDVDDPTVRQVEYNPERVRFMLDRDKELFGMDEHFIHTLLYTKAREWSYEREWRVIANLQQKDEGTGFYYVAFGPQLTLREVILGCRNPTPVGQVAKLARNNHASVRVCKARPAFQEFAMVENKSIKPISVPGL